MKKNLILTVGATVLVACLLFLLYGIIGKLTKKKQIHDKIQTLSFNRMVTMDSTPFEYSSEKPLVLIHFNSDCEHCQYEMKEIKRNIHLFKNLELTFLSSEHITQISKTSKDYDLSGYNNIRFAKINPDHVYETFGALATPHIFIYNKEHQLVREFKGETKVEAILNSLKQ